MAKLNLIGKRGSGKTVKVDDELYEELSKQTWHVGTHGYPAGSRNGQLLHRIVMDAKKGQYVDHINGNKLDCRKSNLRIVTNQQNAFNSKTHKDSGSGYKGVFWYKRDKKWHSQITINNKRIHIGYFKDLFDAVGAYNSAASQLFGEHARLNEV